MEAIIQKQKDYIIATTNFKKILEPIVTYEPEAEQTDKDVIESYRSIGFYLMDILQHLEQMELVIHNSFKIEGEMLKRRKLTEERKDYYLKVQFGIKGLITATDEQISENTTRLNKLIQHCIEQSFSYENVKNMLEAHYIFRLTFDFYKKTIDESFVMITNFNDFETEEVKNPFNTPYYVENKFITLEND